MNIKFAARRIVLSLVVVLIGAAGTGCATDKAVISQAQQAHTGLEPAVITDPQLSGYIQRVGDRIIAAAKELNAQGYGPRGKEDKSWMFSKDMQFHFVNSKTLNAFTTGGEHMYIYTELFQQAKSEDELAAVMSHEFAHVYARHVQKGMNRQYTILAAAAAAGGAGYLVGGKEHGSQYAGLGAGAAALAGNFVGMSYTRDDEAQADELGFGFYTHAGWDPNKFGDFFQEMIDKGYDKGSEYLSDHPSLKSRVELAKKRAAALPAQASAWRQPPIANDAEFKTLQARSVAVGKTMPTDQSLAQAQKLLAALPRSCLTPAIQPDQQRAEQQVLTEVKQREDQQKQGQQTSAKRRRNAG